MGQLYGFHIGVEKYGDIYANSVNRLNGCYNDMTVVGAIARRAGAKSEHIKLMRDARREDVEEHMAKLVKDLREGDMLLFSFAGHGYPIYNESKDPEDGKMDESICLSDAIFSDDNLFDLLATFAAGVRLVCFFDSCHSGTMSQFQYPPPFASSRPVAEEGIGPHLLQSRQVYPGQYRGNHTGLVDASGNEGYLPAAARKPISAVGICYSACGDGPFDFAYERDGQGLFTAATQDIVSKQPGVSYLELAKLLEKEDRLIEVDQTPMVTPLPSLADAKRRAFYRRERFLQL